MQDPCIWYGLKTCVIKVSFSLQLNGLSTQGLDQLGLTSTDRALRSHNTSLASSGTVHSATQPLEAKSIPPQLANALEHIVAQVDIIQQACIYQPTKSQTPCTDGIGKNLHSLQKIPTEFGKCRTVIFTL